jgi:two-component sensor histidine kinase
MPVFADPAAGALTKPSAPPIGVVVIADLLSRDLQPLLTAGSLVTRTGETILVQLGAGGGRFLSSGSRPARGGFVSDALLRAASSAAASSGNDKRSPLLQFVDYRGVNVVASIKKIPSLNSAVIFKVDRDEALAAFRRVLPLEGLTALSVFLMYFGLIVMFNRFAVAREMRLTMAQQGLENQRLETKVAERTGELERTNEQLHRELAERLSAEAGLAEKIEMLNRAEIERESLVTSLERALSEKIVLLKEVHHRVKNNMAVVAGLLAMQAEKVDDDADRSALEDSRQRVLSMALIHESLYATEHLDRVNFGAYVHQLSTGLFGTFSKLASLIELDIQAEEIDLPVDRAIPCGLILNELLSNALKHAFPKGRRGKIRIQFQRLPSGEFLLSCQDDGVGIAPDFDWQHAHSLGLKIIGILAKQIDGAFTLSRVDGKTLFELRVPAIAGR